jgi:hypothetical protein
MLIATTEDADRIVTDDRCASVTSGNKVTMTAIDALETDRLDGVTVVIIPEVVGRHNSFTGVGQLGLPIIVDGCLSVECAWVSK